MAAMIKPTSCPPLPYKTSILHVDASKLGEFVFDNPEKPFIEDWKLQLTPGSPDAAKLKQAALQLQNSEIPVAFSTETVYGLGADATRSAAVRGIYKAKQRPSDNPLIVHVSSLRQLRQLLTGCITSEASTGLSPDPIPPIYFPLISRFWPGPLTILLPLPTPSPFAPEVTTGLATVGVRMPSSLLALALIHLSGVPLAAPSANASSKPSPTTSAHVLHDLNGRIETIIDGGSCQVGLESTVVDGLSTPPLILRPGVISLNMLRECSGWEYVRLGYTDGAEASTPRAPGMKYKHYSPKAKVILVRGQLDMHTVRQYATYKQSLGILQTKKWAGAPFFSKASISGTTIDNKSRAEAENLGGVARHILENTRNEFPPVPDPQLSHLQVDSAERIEFENVWSIALGTDAAAIAKTLFSALRELDLKGADVIFVEAIDEREGESAAAVMNRLRKAAEKELII